MKPSIAAAPRAPLQVRPIAVLKTLLLAVTAVLAVAGPVGVVSAMAQTDPPPPPKYEAVDGNGVDLLSGSLAIGQQPVNSIGEGAGGLNASQTVTIGALRSSHYSYVKLARDGDFNFSTTVVLLGGTETFEGTPQTGAMPDSYTSGQIAVDGNEFVYTQKNGTVARFEKVTISSIGPPTRTGFLKSVTYPTGDKLTVDIVYGSYMQYESSVGYALAGGLIGGNWSPVAANLKQGGCSAGSCAGPTFANQAALGRSLTVSGTTSTLVVTNPAGGTSRTYTIVQSSLGQQRVTAFTNGVGTWTYSYVDDVDTRGSGNAPTDWITTTTATDPLGNKRVVKSRMSSQHIISDTQGISATDLVGRTTRFQYSADTVRLGAGLLQEIIWPEGNWSHYDYDDKYNVTAKSDYAKGTTTNPIVVSASYGAVCATSKVCDKPDWVRDPLGNQTDFTYDPVHGGVLTVTQPAPVSGGVRPQTRYTYGQFTAMYVRNGVLQAAAAPVWRLTQTSACQTQATCAGTADEIVTSYAYESSAVANNVRLLSTTTRAGDNSLSATTSYAYNDRGDVTSVDGPLPGTGDTMRTYYDASRWKTGQIGPDPDGAGALLYRAGRTTYRADGQVTLTETGTATSQSDTAMSSFSPLAFTRSTYDLTGKLAKTEAGQP